MIIQTENIKEEEDIDDIIDIRDQNNPAVSHNILLTKISNIKHIEVMKKLIRFY